MRARGHPPRPAAGPSIGGVPRTRHRSPAISPMPDIRPPPVRRPFGAENHARSGNEKTPHPPARRASLDPWRRTASAPLVDLMPMVTWKARRPLRNWASPQGKVSRFVLVAPAPPFGARKTRCGWAGTLGGEPEPPPAAALEKLPANSPASTVCCFEEAPNGFDCPAAPGRSGRWSAGAIPLAPGRTEVASHEPDPGPGRACPIGAGGGPLQVCWPAPRPPPTSARHPDVLERVHEASSALVGGVVCWRWREDQSPSHLRSSSQDRRRGQSAAPAVPAGRRPPRPPLRTVVSRIDEANIAETKNAQRARRSIRLVPNASIRRDGSRSPRPAACGSRPFFSAVVDQSTIPPVDS